MASSARIATDKVMKFACFDVQRRPTLLYCCAKQRMKLLSEIIGCGHVPPAAVRIIRATIPTKRPEALPHVRFSLCPYSMRYGQLH